jgi:hypothetical protein
MEEIEMKDRMVIKHSLAKLLLKEGFVIKDIQPKKNEDGTTDYTRAVYIFKADKNLDEAINRLK